MLADYLATNIFHLLLVVVRLTPIFLFFPGISTRSVPTRFRIAFVFLFALALLPMVGHLLPDQPTDLMPFFLILIHEFMIGAFIAGVLLVMSTALSIAGLMIARQSGLMNAQVFDPIADAQGAVVSGLLSNLFVLLMFATGLHHVILLSVADSYFAFMPDSPIIYSDFAAALRTILVDSFALGVRIAGPFLIFGLTFQITLGMVSRISPQTNVMMAAMPAQNLLGFLLMTIAIPGAMLVYLRYYDNVLRGLFGPVAGNG